jgi:hypothetical protein
VSAPDATPGPLVAAACPGVALAVVYGCYSTTGELVYVGSTGNLADRLNVHRRVTPFYDRIATVRHGRHLSTGRAREVEARLISLLRPPLNRAGNRDYMGLSQADQRAVLHAHMRRLPVVDAAPSIVDETQVGEATHRRIGTAWSRIFADLGWNGRAVA